MILLDLCLKNFYHINDPKYLDFCTEARKFFYYLRSVDRSQFDKNQFIERPYAFQMTREFASNLGMDLTIMDECPYFQNMFRYLFTSEEYDKPTLPTHMDTCTDGVIPAVVNFPLINCNEQTKTKWYRVIDGVPDFVTNKGGQINSNIAANKTPQASNCVLECVEEVSFTNNKPHLFRTSRWHEVVNYSGKERVICSLLFKPPMIYDDIVYHYQQKGLI